MLNRSRITVSFPTPLIFHYHLPLKTKYFRYFTSAVPPFPWLLGLVILNDFENLPIYLISPFPGSQQMVTQIWSFELDSFFHIYCMLIIEIWLTLKFGLNLFSLYALVRVIKLYKNISNSNLLLLSLISMTPVNMQFIAVQLSMLNNIL